MKIIKSLEESCLLIKRVSEKNENEAKNKKVLLLLGNLLTGKGVKQPKSSNIPRQRVMRVGEGTIRAGGYF